MKLEKLVLYYFLVMVVVVMLILKVGGAYWVSNPAEYRGFCKLQDRTYIPAQEACVDLKGSEPIPVTNVAIKNFCNKPDLISTKVFSKCFHAG